jgi:hypothetical protein
MSGAASAGAASGNVSSKGSSGSRSKGGGGGSGGILALAAVAADSPFLPEEAGKGRSGKSTSKSSSTPDHFRVDNSLNPPPFTAAAGAASAAAPSSSSTASASQLAAALTSSAAAAAAPARPFAQMPLSAGLASAVMVGGAAEASGFMPYYDAAAPAAKRMRGGGDLASPTSAWRSQPPLPSSQRGQLPGIDDATGGGARASAALPAPAVSAASVVAGVGRGTFAMPGGGLVSVGGQASPPKSLNSAERGDVGFL